MPKDALKYLSQRGATKTQAMSKGKSFAKKAQQGAAKTQAMGKGIKSVERIPGSHRPKFAPIARNPKLKKKFRLPEKLQPRPVQLVK